MVFIKAFIIIQIILTLLLYGCSADVGSVDIQPSIDEIVEVVTTTTEQTTTSTSARTTTTYTTTSSTTQTTTTAVTKLTTTEPTVEQTTPTTESTTTEATTTTATQAILETTTTSEASVDAPQSAETYLGTFRATYYHGAANPCCGGSGRMLVSCYIKQDFYKGSVASRFVYENYGYERNGKTMVRVEFPKYPELNGWYSVDDCCASMSVADFYFADYSTCPWQLLGVTECEMWIS